MATVQWTHSVRLRKHLRNRHGTMFHRTCNVLRAYGVRLQKHLANRHCTVFNRGIARQGGINARALARRADGIDSVVVVVADLRHELRLQHIAVADRKARRHGVAIDDCHLEAVCAASLQGEVDRRVGNHIGLCGYALACRDNARCAVCVANVRGRAAAVLRARGGALLDQAVDAVLQRLDCVCNLFLGRKNVRTVSLPTFNFSRSY